MTARHIGLLVLLGAIWGAAFMLIKIAVVDIEPATLVAVRIAITALILFAVMRVSGIALPRGSHIWKDFYFVGMLGLVVPFLLIGWGQRLIPSSTTAILGATTPLFAAIINVFTRNDERINAERVVGLVTGFTGVLIAIGYEGAKNGNIWGELCVLGAAVCYALSALYGRRAFSGMPPIIPSTGQMIASTSVLIPIAFFWNGFPTRTPAASSLIALALLAVFCTAIAYLIYYRLMDDVGATKVSMVSYLVAPFGVVYGAAVLAEPIAPNAILGLVVIILGILIAGGSWRALLPKRA